MPYNHYRILGKKGEGTFSEVMKAVHLATDRPVAMKLMKRRVDSWNEVNGLGEIQALRKLSGHPNIIQILDIVFEDCKLAIVFELMDMNMYEVIKDRKTFLPEARVAKWMFQLFQALSYIHGCGIFHRDVKPENLLVTDATLKLADFGSCCPMNGKQPFTEYISTRWYRAPECLLTGGFYGPKMDIWASGCVWFEVMSLQPLFPGRNEVDQVTRIHGIVGTPSPSDLEEVKKSTGGTLGGGCIKDFNFAPIKGVGFAKRLSHCSPELVTLVEAMLKYAPSMRPTAKDVSRSGYFQKFGLQPDQAGTTEGLPTATSAQQGTLQGPSSTGQGPNSTGQGSSSTGQGPSSTGPGQSGATLGQSLGGQGSSLLVSSGPAAALPGPVAKGVPGAEKMASQVASMVIPKSSNVIGGSPANLTLVNQKQTQGSLANPTQTTSAVPPTQSYKPAPQVGLATGLTQTVPQGHVASGSSKNANPTTNQSGSTIPPQVAYKDQAQSYKDQASGYKGQASGYKDQAQGYKDQAPTIRSSSLAAIPKILDQKVSESVAASKQKVPGAFLVSKSEWNSKQKPLMAQLASQANSNSGANQYGQISQGASLMSQGASSQPVPMFSQFAQSGQSSLGMSSTRNPSLDKPSPAFDPSRSAVPKSTVDFLSKYKSNSFSVPQAARGPSLEGNLKTFAPRQPSLDARLKPNQLPNTMAKGLTGNPALTKASPSPYSIAQGPKFGAANQSAISTSSTFNQASTKTLGLPSLAKGPISPNSSGLGGLSSIRK